MEDAICSLLVDEVVTINVVLKSSSSAIKSRSSSMLMAVLSGKSITISMGGYGITLVNVTLHLVPISVSGRPLVIVNSKILRSEVFAPLVVKVYELVGNVTVVE